MIKKLEWGVCIITDCFTLFSFCSLVKHINLGLMRSNRSKQKELKFSYMCTFFRDDLTKKNKIIKHEKINKWYVGYFYDNRRTHESKC